MRMEQEPVLFPMVARPICSLSLKFIIPVYRWDHDLEVTASLGWESLKIDNSLAKNNGLTAYFSLKRIF